MDTAIESAKREHLSSVDSQSGWGWWWLLSRAGSQETSRALADFLADSNLSSCHRQWFPASRGNALVCGEEAERVVACPEATVWHCFLEHCVRAQPRGGKCVSYRGSRSVGAPARPRLSGLSTVRGAQCAKPPLWSLGEALVLSPNSASKSLLQELSKHLQSYVKEDHSMRDILYFPLGLPARVCSLGTVQGAPRATLIRFTYLSLMMCQAFPKCQAV